MMHWSFKVTTNLKLKNILNMKLLQKQSDYRLGTSSITRGWVAQQV